MNTILIKLLPRLRRWQQRRSPPSHRPSKQPQTTIVAGVLDISKEACDAIAAQDREAGLAFEIAFPPQSPTDPRGSCGPAEQMHEGPGFAQAPSSFSSRSSSSCPHSRPPVAGAAAAPLRQVPASGLGQRRNFKGRTLDTSLPLVIPPMPTTPPPRPDPACSGASAASPRSLRRQPRFTDLNTSSPIRRSRTFPLSKNRDPAVRSCPPCIPGAHGDSAAANCSAQVGDAHFTPQSITPAGSPMVLAFPLPLSTTAAAPHHAAREMFPTEVIYAVVEPLVIVKRPMSGAATSASGDTRHESASSSLLDVDPALYALLSELGDVYADLRDSELSLVSISLSSSDEGVTGDADADQDEDEEDLHLDEEVSWRSRYLDGAAWGSPEREAWPCSYALLPVHARSTAWHSVQRSRSLPEFPFGE
ncbi:hypothetical protein B0H15DRAFT_431834 [Mycena belliarum]|uniref:Uncharacterized protein n=1 Tax=Mycena belliarum TaxID=1033014 RepID=A0AAD6XNU9_9AGAR|nr:hypothetical protein B0H15DRAFT_431834 [Mycena belliae]